MNAAFLFLIGSYRRLISPWLGTNCRFHPSCSEYAEEAFRKRDFFHAAAVSARRLLKCHPFHHGGFDPFEA